MPRSIKIATTDKSLSIYGGLVVAKEAMDLSGFRGFITSSMPEIKTGTSRSVDKFESMMLGAMAGAENLDDLERRGEDPAYQATVARTYSAKSYGDYLRSFKEYQCKTLQYKLAELSYELRAKAVEVRPSLLLWTLIQRRTSSMARRWKVSKKTTKGFRASIPLKHTTNMDLHTGMMSGQGPPTPV